MKNSLVLATLFSAVALPGLAADFTDTAEVISTVPVYGTISEPRRQCWTETVNTYQQAPRSYGGTVFGGITGGLIGSTIGRGDGRVAAAAAGAAIGALVGNRADERHAYSTVVPQQVQRCQTVDTPRQGLTGYQVTYNYNGRNAMVVLPYDPGPTVRIRVGVSAQDHNDITRSAAHVEAPHVASAVPQPQYATPQEITYVDADGNVPIWAYKPYKRPRPPASN